MFTVVLFVQTVYSLTLPQDQFLLHDNKPSILVSKLSIKCSAQSDKLLIARQYITQIKQVI
jgi:hypothetical protein